MSRKHRAQVREVLPDPRFQDVVVTKFVNSLMIGGKKAVAESIFYGALDLVEKKTSEEPLKLFKKALSNVKPAVEVSARILSLTLALKADETSRIVAPAVPVVVMYLPIDIP